MFDNNKLKMDFSQNFQTYRNKENKLITPEQIKIITKLNTTL